MYTKLVTSNVFPLLSDLGLIVEVNEGKTGKPNTLVLWLQYKDDKGQWQFKGSKGSTGIHIPIVDGLAKFLNDSLKEAFDVSAKHDKEKASNPIDISKLSNEQLTALRELIATTVKAPAAMTTEPEISLENLLNVIAKAKKGNKKK